VHAQSQQPCAAHKRGLVSVVENTVKSQWSYRFLLLILDVLLLESSFFGVYWWRFRTGLFENPVSFAANELLLPSLIVAAYWVTVLSWFGLYRFDPLQSRRETAQRSFKAAGVGVLILFILTFNPEQPLPRSRIVLLLYGSAMFLVVSGDRVVLLTVLRQLRIRGIGAFRTLLVGGGRRAADTLKYLREHPGLGLQIKGFLSARESEQAALRGCSHLGTFSRFHQVARGGVFDAVLLAVDNEDERQLGRFVSLLRSVRLRAFIPADQYNLLVGQVKPVQVHGYPLVDVRPELLSPIERILKRLTDVLAAAMLLCISLPLWMLLIVLIPLTSPGPIFYSQKRVGRGGRVFTLYKFRSMVHDAESETGAVLASERDPRVTAVGRVLRALRLDELPQLMNVFIGDMSIVGPRPERVEFVKQFVSDVPLYRRRLNVKPGITGWSQVHLKYDTRADQIPLKLRYDFYYIEHMSLPLDMKIMFMTFFVMLRGEGL
jgi:exopolysaccharide biosynthesis polyprenyl glycosylphosphotransferase